jgi:hypothetical protein
MLKLKHERTVCFAGLGFDLLAKTSKDESISDTGILTPGTCGNNKLGLGSTFFSTAAVAAAAVTTGVDEAVVAVTVTSTVCSADAMSVKMSWFEAGRSN